MRILFYLLSAFVVLFSTAIYAGEPDNLAQQGFDSFSTGNYREAAESFLAALELDENHVQANTGIIKVYLLVGDYSQAAEKAISLSAKGKASPEIIALGADAYVLNGSYEKALDLYRKALALENSHIHSLLGAARMESLSGSALFTFIT